VGGRWSCADAAWLWLVAVHDVTQAAIAALAVSAHLFTCRQETATQRAVQ